ncbi:MAG: 23S rRNA (guanosine(2251)-2'-O)-methyltransferase RlmB [bacterium]
MEKKALKVAKRGKREFICGVHASLAALERGPERVRHLYIAAGRTGEPGTRARKLAEIAGISMDESPARALDELAGTRQHQGLVVEVLPTPVLGLDALLEGQPPNRPPILLLDGIQDPRNLGAILRTAAALGAGGAVWPRDAAADLTPTVAKAAAGALESLPLSRVTNMVRAVSAVKEAGYWVLAGDLEGEVTLGESELPRPAALVLGREGKGVRRLVRESCDIGVRIPLAGGIVGALNVAVAAGILLFALAGNETQTQIRSAPLDGGNLSHPNA